VNQGTRRRDAAVFPGAAVPRGGGGALGAVVDRLIRGCVQQGVEMQGWPFESIAQIVSPDDTQRNALAELRSTAQQTADRLLADCPQDVPAAPSLRFDAVEQAIDAALAGFATVQPVLQVFYGALDDEQKARLMRDLAANGAQERSQARSQERSDARSQARSDVRSEERSERRSYRERRWRADEQESNRAASPVCSLPRSRGRGGEGAACANRWAAVCEDLAAALRGWPIREIERGVRLSETQRVAFYELVTSSLKAADTLAGACPAETALTPVGRMETMRKRLAAVRQATVAIRPALTRFYEALDQGQKVRFAGMS
jgi:hypothetical protein